MNSFALLLCILCAQVMLLVVKAQYDDMDPEMMQQMMQQMGMDPYGGGMGGGMGMDPYGGYGGGMDPYGGYGGGGGASSLITLDTLDEVKEFIATEGEENALVMGYFDETDTDNKDIFVQLSSQLGSSYKFAVAYNKDILEDMKIGSSAIYVYKPSKYVSTKDNEKVKARYPSTTVKSDSLERFIHEKSLPLVSEKNSKNEVALEAAKLPIVTVYAEIDHQKNAKGVSYVTNRVRKAAKQFANKITFVVADKNQYSHELSHYDFSLPNSQDIGVGVVHNNVCYSMSEKFNVDNIIAFINDFKAGKLVGKERVVAPKKSQSHDDEDADDGTPSAVVDITNDNYKELVADSTKDIMLEFYAPWCGHCKSLKPEYKKLAAAFKDDDSVMIAAMDATANDIPKGFDVQGYPTVMWIPGNTKKPVSYDDDREASAMIAYVKANRS